MSIRDQIRRDAEAFARLPQAVQDNLMRELATVTTPLRLPYWKWMTT